MSCVVCRETYTMKHIFITGGAGFLGWELVKELLKEEKDARIYLLVRDKRGVPPKKRIMRLVYKDYEKNQRKNILKRIKVIEGDITKKDLGIKKPLLKKLCKKIDVIYHSAALCEFGSKWPVIKKINVDGTKNILDFANACKKNKKFEAFNHISTVGVAGKSKGVFYENDLDKGQEFDNTYERSKFEAEKLCHRYRKKGLSITILRPGLITGISGTGEVSEFQMPYQVLHVASLELFNELPVNTDVRYGFVPVDYVARAIWLVSKQAACNETYNLVNKHNISVRHFLNQACQYFRIKRPKLVPEKKYDFSQFTGFCTKIGQVYLPYLLHQNIVFDTRNFDTAMKGHHFTWPKIDKQFLRCIFKYCDKIGYIKRGRR